MQHTKFFQFCVKRIFLFPFSSLSTIIYSYNENLIQIMYHSSCSNMKAKFRQQGWNLFCIFLDVEKAFARIPRVAGRADYLCVALDMEQRFRSLGLSKQISQHCVRTRMSKKTWTHSEQTTQIPFITSHSSMLIQHAVPFQLILWSARKNASLNGWLQLAWTMHFCWFVY